MAWLPTITGANTSPIYPVGSSTNLWPDGGSAASTTSIPNVSGASDPNYWLPIWSGEVINAYDQYNMFEPMVTTETIESGTTKRFPITGTVGHIGVWNAGQELVGDSGTQNPGWFDVSLDQRPMAAFFELDDIHLMLTQWDYRAELARQAGLKLSYIRDKQIACMLAQAAFTANRSPFTAEYSGMNHSTNQVLPPNAKFNMLGLRGAGASDRTDAALLLLEYLERYMVRLSEIDATLDQVYCAVTPQAFHDIRALGIARVSGDLGGGAGRPFFGGVAEAGGLGVPLTQGTFGMTEVLEYMGVKIVKSNHLADLDHVIVKSGAVTDITSGVSSYNNISRGALSNTGVLAAGADTGAVVDLGDAKYDFNWHGYTTGGATNPNTAPVNDGRNLGTTVANNVLNPVKALIWQKSAVCSLRLQGMKVETVKDVRRGTFFTVSSIMAGAGILRPELCGAIQGNYTVA